MNMKRCQAKENPIMRKRAIIIGLILFGILGGAVTATADNDSAAEEATTVGRTPPRLSYLEGQVSFWRPGAADWTQAEINTALAPGDQLYVQGTGNLELQVGARAFVRGGRDAQIALETQEPDFLRFKVTSGQVSFDLRTLAPGRTVEVDTPHGAFTINHEGYYRLDVSDQRTTFVTRRAGRAAVATATGDAVPMQPDESVVIESPAENALAFQSAPAMDAWDTWNYNRTDAVLEAGSSRYLAPGTYGAADLDRYGSWRELPTYGPVWVPAGVAAGWAPYSSGSWMYDAYYGWTWVDTAPWGWAPYHYGRWVYANSYWCWAPGPVGHRAIYAPALVAFFGGPAVSVGISVGGPGVGWVALGWGEPLIPWWGRPGFIHRPWWGGWGGPHCINNRVIHHGTLITVSDIHHYHNSHIHNALIVVDRDRFGHGRIHGRHLEEAHVNNWRPMQRAPDVRPGAASYLPSAHHGRRPPENILRRSTVSFGPQRAHSIQSSKNFEPRSGRPTQPGHARPSVSVDSHNDRRRVDANLRKAPAINRPPAGPLHPRAAKPEAGVRPQRRSQVSSGTARTTSNEARSRSMERPSPFQPPTQGNERRIAPPAPSSPVAQPRVDSRQQIENHRFSSRPAANQAPPRPQQPPVVQRPSTHVSGDRIEGGFKWTPPAAEPGQNHQGNGENFQGQPSGRGPFQNNRGAGGGSGHRFQGRSRN
jgi:Family of unknown function (DUF6600)